VTDELFAECERVGLLCGQAVWLADLPAGRLPHQLTAAETARVRECIRHSIPAVPSGSIREPLPRGGLCLPVERSADEERDERRAVRAETIRNALWNVAANLSHREARGPSLFDEDEAEADPGDELRARWAEWKGLAGDTSAFELAWCVGLFRLLGVVVVLNNGRPEVQSGPLGQEAVRPAVEVLRRHRGAVVERLTAGRPIDSREWQLELVKRAAGGWPVWGFRLGTLDNRMPRSSVYPVLPHDPPPFYDTLQVYRPDCGRAIPATALAVAKLDHEVGRYLPPGGVYVGPAADEYPKGRGSAEAAEAKIRKQHGAVVCWPW
jgi:hypothetical protein